MVLLWHIAKCSDSASVEERNILFPKERRTETFAHSSQAFFFFFFKLHSIKKMEVTYSENDLSFLQELH